jgi:enterochelin esterase family protein
VPESPIEKSPIKGGSWRLGVVALAATSVACSAFRAPGGSPSPALQPLKVSTPAGVSTLPYRVFLPPGYPGGAPYPTLYFLHDYFGDSGILWKQGVIAVLEKRMSAGELPPMVIVAPEGDTGYWSDYSDGSRNYESWVTGALREEIERRYAVRRDRGGRALTGVSMGGFGAVKAALRRPGLYVAASSLSGALLKLDPASVAGYPFWTRRQLARIFGPMGDAGATYEANDLRHLFAAASRATAPRLCLRAGTEDKYDLARLAEDLAAFARERGLDVQTVFEPGGHDWRYWRRSAVDLVAWHAAAFSESAP